MKRKFLVADLLCGAGGSSTGCARALADLGLQMELVCVNHWPIAIETHRLNHPEARHHVQDIATGRPHLIVPEGYLDLLMASPTCTHHSVARGGKPTSDQQRSDPWHIITWLTELRVKRLIIENVWEFTGWGPVDPDTGKPVKDRKGEYFRAWIDTIRRLGFEPEWHKLNSADYGGATTRQRFILKARSDRRAVAWAPLSHAKRPDAKGLKPWRPARDIIDWSIKGKSIRTRPVPLAPKTLARILAGAIKFGWPQPFIEILFSEIERSLMFHLRRAIAHRHVKGARYLKRRTLVRDYVARLRHFRLSPIEFVKGGRSAEAMLITLRRNADGRRLDGPLPALTAGGRHIGIAQPIVLSTASGGAARSTESPMPTATTGGAGTVKRPGCARPMLIEAVATPPCLISPYYGSGSGETCQSDKVPLPSITTKARFGMVVPITHADGSNRARDVDVDPLATCTTAHRGEFALVEGVEQYDILFRMLEPHELAGAMGFNSADASYEFAGTKTDKIKQIGNAVSVELMEAEVKAFAADDVPASEIAA